MQAALDTLGERIRVGAYDIAIEVWWQREGTLRGHLGEYAAPQHRIWISAEASSAALVVDTALHEIMHAIYHVYSIHEDDGEERTVNALATAWTQVYRDNPWLLGWIAEALA